MKVCFICRGYPGLGKVVGCVAMNELLREEYSENYESVFLSYYGGYEYLKSSGHQVTDILSNNIHIGRNAFCTAFGPETRRCVDIIGDFAPDAVVNDGEPYLIEVTEDILNIPTIVLAHPSDLDTPTNTKLAVDLFRYYYSKATLVISHGMNKLPENRTFLGNKAGNVVETNTIIRNAFINNSNNTSRNSPYIVGILGGGSRNASDRFRESTRLLGEWIITVCNDSGIEKATLYCADKPICDALQQVPSSKTEFSLIAGPRDNSSDIIQADVVIGRAGRNLLSEFITLGKKGIVIPVYAEKFRAGNQRRTAERAIQLNPNLNLVLLEDGYDNFQRNFRTIITTQPRKITWKAGNCEALEAVRICLHNIPKQRN